MNGRCQEVCPVAIPLPTLLRGWRDRSWREGLEPRPTRYGIDLYAFLARRPRLYRLASAMGVRALRLPGRGGWGRRPPPAGGGTAYCGFSASEGRTFFAQYP